MYLKMELTNGDIAIRERIYSQCDNVIITFSRFLSLRRRWRGKHVVYGVYRQPGQLAITFDCDVRRIQSD